MDDDKLVDPSSYPEDNGFEHVTPTSTFADSTDQAEEDLYTAGGSSEAEAVQQPLINFGDTDPKKEILAAEPSSTTLPEAYPSEPTPPATPPRTTSREEVTSKPAAPIALAGDHALNSWLKSVDPRVVELVYWRDVKKTGVVFGSLMFVLLSLAFFSFISVVSYFSLAALTVTFSFKVYKNVLNAVQKTGDGDPFKQFLDMEVTLPEQKVHDSLDTALKKINPALVHLRDLFLVKDLVDSIKFGLLLWVLTYIGAWFNGLTLVILAVTAAFTLPKVYETNQAVIDQYVCMAMTQVRQVWNQVKEKIPFPKKTKKE